MTEFGIQATIRAVGTSAVLVMALLMVYLIAALDLEPWLKLVLAAPAGLFILSGGVAWMLSGGEQGTHVEVVDGRRRLSITNLNVFAQAFARVALQAFSRAPLPPPAGVIGPKGPTDQSGLIEGKAELPPEVEVSERPIDIPPDAGRLQ